MAAKPPRPPKPPAEITIPMKTSREVRPLYSDGAIVTGPLGAHDNFGLLFYTDHATAVSAKGKLLEGSENRYEVVDTKIDFHREVMISIVMSKDELRRTAEAIILRLAEIQVAEEQVIAGSRPEPAEDAPDE